MYGATGKPRPAEPRRRLGARAFTLLELMIVLAILALLIAMVWPSLRRPVMRHAIQQAAQELVRDLARARMAAIDSGQIVAWRYEPGGRRYLVTLAESLRDGAEPASELNEDNTGDGSATDDATPDVGFAGLLGEDVVFRDPSAVDDDNQLPPGSALRRMLDDEQRETEKVETRLDDDQSDSSFSEPVYFYPTGRAENAEIVLLGPDGYRVTVRVRGLTGAASIGSLEHMPRSTEETDERGKAPDRSTPTEEFVEPDVAND